MNQHRGLQGSLGNRKNNVLSDLRTRHEHHEHDHGKDADDHGTGRSLANIGLEDAPSEVAKPSDTLIAKPGAAQLSATPMGMNINPYTNKPFVHFYTTKRVGGGVQNPEYMRAIKNAAS